MSWPFLPLAFDCGLMAVIRLRLGSRVSQDVVKGGTGGRDEPDRRAPQENSWRELSVPLRRPTPDQG
jgi:hypothetical protein